MSERTLGVVLGTRNRPETHRRVSRIFRLASAQGTSLGSRYLGIGATVVACAQLCAGMMLSIARWDAYSSAGPIIAGWALLIVGVVVSAVLISVRGQRLPRWAFYPYVVVLAGVVALDFIAIWRTGDIGATATASVSAGFALLIWLTVRSSRAVLGAAALLAAAFAAAIVGSGSIDSVTDVPAQLSTLALAVAPPVAGVFVLTGYRRMVQVELDRVLVQSTTTAPRFAVGMLASEELARLDLAAEQLLEGVASGSTPLPLAAETASQAAGLATELRLHLIEGRRETWLYHAITESVRLGESVTLRDPGSLAGLLDPPQRDGLLSAVWLLVADTVKGRGARTAVVTLGPIAPRDDPAPARKVIVPISIVTTGVPRNALDPAVWNALGRIGECRTSSDRTSLRIDVRCAVENPADQ